MYPTFFGSDVNEVLDGKYFAQNSYEASDNDLTIREAWISTLNKAAENHPEINFSVTALADSRYSTMSATYELSGGEGNVTEEWLQTELIDKLDGSLNAVVETMNLSEDQDEWVYSTDHHWRTSRALVTYNRLADELDWEHVEWKDPIKVVNRWYGDQARIGKDCRWADTMWDLPITFDNLEYYKYNFGTGLINEEPSKESGVRAKTLASKKQKMPQTTIYDGYNAYFGTYNGLIVNTEKAEGKTCLLIGDSYTYCLRRFIANNYAKTYVIAPGNAGIDKDFETLIEEYQPDDIIVMTQALKYHVIAEKSPNFLGLDPSEVQSDGTELDD